MCKEAKEFENTQTDDHTHICRNNCHNIRSSDACASVF